MIALISDIHGNYPALKKVLEELNSLGCKQIISLGDVAGYYCMINECIELLRNYNIVHLMGNHDYYLVKDTWCTRSKAANDCLSLQKKIITKENKEWLSSSQDILKQDNSIMVHGGFKDYKDEYIYKLSKGYFDGLGYKYYFSGHTHVQIKFDFGGKIYCNPGAVGQPRDGDPRAAFAIWNDEDIILKRVEYPIEEIVDKMRLYGFNDYYTDGLYKGEKIGGGVSPVKINA